MSYFKNLGISNSSLSYINPEQGGSPARYKHLIIEGNKKEDSTPSLKNGKIIHKYVEDKEAFCIADVDKPTEMMASWVERVADKIKDRTLVKEDIKTIISVRNGAYSNITDEAKLFDKFIKEGKKYHDYLVKTNGKDFVLTPGTKHIIESCIASILCKEKAKKLLFDKPEFFEDKVLNEQELYWSTIVDGVTLHCKGLVDNLRILHSQKKFIITDFKTTGKPIGKYPKAFEDWRTYRQLAYYEWGVRQVFPECSEYDVEFHIVAVETHGLYECRVFNIPYQWIEKGRDEYQKLLKLIASCVAKNCWDIEEQTLLYVER